ncbi:hypothetical protein LJC45_03515 [Alistipes sp. OttesenSCG-928-B03]|nr:hypothetical protein [Alistipes sp. OttesenSCG-928-B03]
MGSIRNWDYEAVIGIGGKAPWKQDADIKYKINWIGLGPKRISPTSRGVRVVFEHFELYEENGLNIEDNFPNLFEYMYGSRKRFDMSPNLPENVLEEVMSIISSIKDSHPSEAYDIAENEFLNDLRSPHFSTCGGCHKDKQVEITICEY